MSDWVPSNLGNLIDIKHGFAFDGAHFHNEPIGDILLTPGNFAIGGGFKGDKFKYYNGPIMQEFVLQEGDLLVTMTDLSKNGDTLGYPAIVPGPMSGRRFLHNQRLGKIRILPDAELDSGFLYYLLCTRAYRNEVLASATGTTVKHTSPERIKKFGFFRPDLHEQREIADVLGCLDAKIELNRGVNHTLEAMVRAIFKSWFLDFDPVSRRAEGRQPIGLNEAMAALFPSQFVDSKLGKIPKGWKTGLLGDVAENPRRGLQPQNIVSGTPYIALDHMPRRNIALSEWGNAEEAVSNKFQFLQGEFLFGKLRPYFHKVGVASVDGVCSTDILVVRPRENRWYAFVLGHLSSDVFVAYTDAGSTGTKMPRTSWPEMARYEVCLPDPVVAESFNNLAKPMIDKIRLNILESRTLAALRNTLLPKLLSGEIRIGEAQQTIATSV